MGADREILAQIQRELHEANTLRRERNKELHEANFLRRELLAIFRQKDILVTHSSEAPSKESESSKEPESSKESNLFEPVIFQSVPENSLRSIEVIFGEKGIKNWEKRIKSEKAIPDSAVSCQWIVRNFDIAQKDQRIFAKEYGIKALFRAADKRNMHPIWERDDAIMMIRYFDSLKHE